MAVKLNRPRSSASRALPRSNLLLARSAKKDFPIVGVGASAGGLDAFTQLLTALPAELGMAFILVQHLDPENESGLATFLARATKMPVREATQRMQVRPDEVYVIPPDSTMSLARGRLELKPRGQARTPHVSIDFFFQSLAREKKEGAIGVVLSGNATDGTNGLEAIKAGGGITFAQDKSARYDSMPRHAIASGCVDFVMTPTAVAGELARIATHPYLRGLLPSMPADAAGERENSEAAPAEATNLEPGASASTAKGLARIIELVREQTGVDFSLYRADTLHRRIMRRMLLNRRNSIDDYARLVTEDAGELKALQADMLISVTSFFRDESAFDAIRQVVFPKLVKAAAGDSIRIWTIGCSSGQEVYSLAMAYMEVVEAYADRAPRLQIFGTDLNESLLTKARHGLYPKSLAHEISAERLRNFFVEEDGGYRVIKSLREICIFARQDLLSDPPFSRMDLVSCRNVLIYIEPAAQQRILPMLHYALKPEGFLFLGSSESVGTFSGLFEVRDRKQKIFVRRPGSTPVFFFPRRDRHMRDSRGSSPSGAPLPQEGLRTELHAYQEADRIMVALFAPPGVLVDSSLTVLQFRGSTEAYLAPAAGKASFHLLKLARETLLPSLRAAINRARRRNEPVRREKVRFDKNKADTVTVRVIPLKNLRGRYFLILFETPRGGTEAAASPSLSAEPGKGGERRLQRRIAVLERELREARDSIQTLQQQHDTAHDELQASNEEVQSTNEELQSINEELESGNEELVAVNDEMTHRNTELSRLNSDLSNFHVSINTPIVVLAGDLTIRRFTPTAEKLFNLLATDVGRPLAGIRHNLQLENLEELVSQVVGLIAVREVEVRDQDGRWYLLRARPYLTVNNKIDGAVLVLLDIDDLKRAQTLLTDHAGKLEAQVMSRTQELRETNSELEAFSYSISHDMRAPLRAMQGFARLLLKANEALLDADSVDQLRRISASAGRLDLLISDVLTYSRLMRSEIVLQPVELDKLVPLVIATYPQLHADNVQIAIESRLPAVLANEASMIQCLSNLLSNAVKFVAPGVSPRVRIYADEVEGEPCLWIEDNGIGIDPRNHQRIWAIFTKIERARDYEGTGIGLAIVRKAVERMNGKIGVESALGKGSRFWLRLRRG